LYIPTNVSP